MKPFQEELLRQVRERETAPPPVDIKKDAAILKVGRPDRLDRAVAPIPTEQQAPTRQAPPVENRLPALTGRLPISSAARSLASPDLALSPDMRDSDIDSFAKAEPQRRLREVGSEWHPGLADEVDPTLGRNLRQTMAAAYSQGHKLLLRADDPPAELQLDRLAREIQQEAAAGATSTMVGASQGTRIAAHARSLKMSPESFRAQVKAWDPNFDLDAMEDAAKDGPVYLSWKQVEARDQAIANAAAAKEKAANERRLRTTEKASRGELEGNIVRSAREAAEQSRARAQAELEALGVTGPELTRAFDDSVTYQTMLENTLKTVGLPGKSTTTERKLSAIRDYNQAQSKFLQVQARTFEAVRDQTQKDRATVAVGTPHVLSGTASALGDDYRDTAVNLSPTEGHDAAVRILTSWSIDSDWAIAEVNNTTMTNATADILIDKYMQAALRANTLAPGDDVGRFRREMLAVIGGLMIPGNYGGAVFLSQDGSSAVHDDAYGKGFLAHLGQTAEDMAPRYQLVGITKVDGVYKPVLRPESMATWLGSAVADTPQAMTAGAAKVVAEWVYNPNSRDLTLDDLLEGSRRGLRDRTDAFEFGQEYQDEYYGTALKMAKWGLENRNKVDAAMPSWWPRTGVESLPDADTLAAVATANFVALTMLGAVASPGTPEAVLTAAGKLAKTAKVAGAAASTASATQRAGRYIDRVFPGSAARRTLETLDESAEGALDSARAIRQGDAQAASLLEAQAGTDRVLQKGAPAVRGAVDRFVSDQIVEASRYDQANADARDVDLADALPGEARNQRASLHTGARKEDIKANLKMTGESGRRFGSRLESIDSELAKADAAGRKAGDFATHADGLPRIRASLDKSLFDVSRKLRVVADPQAELAAPGKAKMRPFLRRLAQYEDAMTDPARWLREVSRDVEDLAVLDQPAVAASLSLKHPKKTAQEIDELASKTIVRRRKALRRQLKQWHRQMRIARFQADPVYALNRARQALLAEVDAVAMGNLVVGEIAAKTGYLPTLQDVGGVPAAADVGAARLARPKTAIGRIRDVLSNPKRVLSRGAGDWVQLLTDSFGMSADEATELARVEDRRAAYAARSKGVTVDAWWTKRIGDAKAAQVQAATDMATALRSGPLNGAVSRADDLHQALRQSRAWRAAAEDSGLLRLLEEMGTTIVSLDELSVLLDDGPVVASRRALFSQAERPEAVRALQAMADALKATGLETSTALAFADRVAGGKADASFVKGLIEIGLDQDPKAQLGAFHHELVHGLRAEGILDDAAWSVLDANAEAWLDDARLASGGQTVRQRNARLNLSPEALREEAVADAYRAWKEGRLSDAGGPSNASPTGIVGIFERISAFFDGIRRWLAGGGYRNAEDVFKAIAEGRIEAEGLQRMKRSRAGAEVGPGVRSGAIPDGEAPTESNVKLVLDDAQTHARRGDYDFNPVGRDEASDFLAKHHYAGGAGNTMSLALGMRDKSGDLVGVAWWQAPGSPNVARWAAQQYVLPNGTAVQPSEVVTLSRLAVAPGQPTNAASMLIGQSLRRLRQAGRAGAKPFKVALTYADGLERHVGGIYQATNWKYTGESRARPRWTDSNGKMVAAKATENRTFAEMEAQGLTRAEGQPKQRYVIAIDPRLQFVGPDAGPPPKQSARPVDDYQAATGKLYSSRVTETPEFKAWFGDSKVVDESGQPLRVFHGTKSDFDSFSAEKAESREGFYFTGNPRAASAYGNGDGGSVLPVYLSIRNPAPFEEYATRSRRAGGFEAAAASLQADGFDGVLLQDAGNESTWIAFSPEQIKSVSNRGTFDPNDPRILFSSRTIGRPAAGRSLPIETGPRPMGSAQTEGWDEVDPVLRPLTRADLETYFGGPTRTMTTDLADAEPTVGFWDRRPRRAAAAPDKTGALPDKTGDLPDRKLSSRFVGYHGTQADFDSFKPGAEGIHFGATPEQAMHRAPGGKVLQVEIDARRVVDMPDLLRWDARSLVRELPKYADAPGLDSDLQRALEAGTQQARASGQRLSVAQFEAVASAAVDAGIDVIRYQNQGEGGGIAYLALDPNKIKRYSSRADKPAAAPDEKSPEWKQWSRGLPVIEAGQPMPEGGAIVRAMHHGDFDVDIHEAFREGQHFGTEAAARMRAFMRTAEARLKNLEIEETEPGVWHWRIEGDTDSMDYTDGFPSAQAARQAGEDYAESVDNMIDAEDLGTFSEVFIRLTNPKRVPDVIDGWDEIIAKAKEEGHDGLVYRNNYEDKGSDSYVVFDPSQVKMVDNERPTEDPRARYSSRATETPEFKAWFGDSKVVDAAGKPLVVYHGTPQGGFGSFDRGESKRGHAGFYFTDNYRMANGYSQSRRWARKPRVDPPQYFKSVKEIEDSGRAVEIEREYYVDGDRFATMDDVRSEMGDVEPDQIETILTLYRDGEKVDDFASESDLVDYVNANPEWALPQGETVYEVFLSMKQPEIIDAGGANWDSIPWGDDGQTWTTRDIESFVRDYDDGTDGIIFRNVQDNGADTYETADVFVVFDPAQIKSVDNRGTWSRNDDRILYSSRTTAFKGDPGLPPGFYSGLRRAVEDIKQERLTPEQFAGILGKAAVKADEIAWTRLGDFLEGKRSVTKTELLEWLDENAVSVEERVLEEKPSARMNAAQKAMQSVHREKYAAGQRLQATADVPLYRDNPDIRAMLPFKIGGAWMVELSNTSFVGPKEVRDLLLSAGHPEKADAFMAAFDDYVSIAERWEQASKEVSAAAMERTKPQYTNYTLPGGTNQREFLFKLPPLNGDSKAAFSTWLQQSGYGVYYRSPPSRQERIRAEYDAIPGRERALGETTGADYTAPHFNGPDAENLLLHFRVNDRVGPKGERLLHIEEVQSDWHEKGRKEGYRGPPVDISQIPADVENAVQAFTDNPTNESRSDMVDVLATHDIRADRWLTTTVGNGVWGVLDGQRGVPLREYILEIMRHNQGYRESKNPPQAPFSKTWHEVALKRALRIAAEEGYDGVTWTKGIQQVERYSDDLRQKVDSLDWQAPTNQGGDIDALRADSVEKGRLAREAMDAGDPAAAAEAQRAYNAATAALRGAEGDTDIRVHAMKDNRVIQTFTTKPDGTLKAPVEMPNGDRATTLAAVIGKENAETILKRAADEAKGSLTSDDLTVGGEGLKGFYDKMLTSAMGKIAKKFGGRVGETAIGAPKVSTEVHSSVERESVVAMKQQALADGEDGVADILGDVLRDIGGGMDAASAWELNVTTAPADARSIIRRYSMTKLTDDKATVPVHHIAITPAMRADILDQGMPLFSSRAVEQTPEFKAWSKGLPVIEDIEGVETVPSTGAIVRAFHGSRFDNIEEFSRQDTAYGYFFAPDRNTADYYRGGGQGAGRIYDVYLRMEKPADFNDPAVFEAVAREAIFDLDEGRVVEDRYGEVRNMEDRDFRAWLAQAAMDRYSSDAAVRQWVDSLAGDEPIESAEGLLEALNFEYIDEGDVEKTVLAASPALKADLDRAMPVRSRELELARRAHDEGSQDWYMRYQDDFVRAAESMGYDSVVMTDPSPTGSPMSFVVFKPEQIKDVSNKRPTEDPRIQHSRRSGLLELPNASTSFLDDGRAVVRGLQDPNIADAIHEFAHVIRQDMPPADIDAIVKWVQHRGIKIDGVDPVSGKFIPTYRNPNGTRISRADQARSETQAEELFAQGSDAFLRGLAGGTTNRAASLLPKDKDSRSALLNISAWVSQQASGSAVSIPSPVLEVYQRAFDVLPPKPGPVRASPKRAMDMGQTNDLGQPRLHLKEHAQGTSADKLALGDTWAGAAAIDESRPSEVLRNLATMRGRDDTKYESVREGLGNISRLLFSRPSPDKMPWGGFFLGGDPDTDVRQLPPYVRDVSRMGPRWITAVQGDMGALLAQRTRASYERTLDLLAGERNVLLPDGSRALSDDYAYIDEPVQSLLLWFGRALKSNPDGAQALLGMNWGLDADAWSKQEPGKAKALGLLIRTIFDAEGGVPFLAEAQKSLSTLPTSSEVDHVSSAKRLGMALQVILDPKLTKREMTAGIVDALAGPQHILGTPPPQAFNANDRVRLVVLLGSFGGYRRGLDVVAQADVGVTAADAAEYKRWLHGGESDNPEKMNDLMRRFGLYPYFQKVEMLSSLPGSGLWLPQAALDRMNTALRKAIPDLHDSKEGVAYWLAHLVQLKKAEQTRGLIRIRPEYYLANTAGSGAQTATVLGLREGATQMATLMADTALLSIPAVGHALGAFDAVAGSITGQRKLAEATRRVFLRAGDRVRHGMQMLLHPTEFSSYAVIDRLKLFDGADEPILLRSGQPLMHKGKPLTYAKLRTIAVSMGTAADFEHAEMTATLGSIIQDAQRKLPAHLQPGVRGKVQDVAQSSAAVARDWLQGVTVDTVRRTSKNFSEAERFGLIAALVERGVPPEKAGWLTTYVLFDFGGTGTPTERNSLVGLIYPYAVYQKNANAMGFDALFDPSRVYRMNVARRWAQKGPSALDAQWTGEQTDYEKNFGLDVAAMPPELQQKFWALSEWVRFGFGPRAYWTPMVAATIEARTGVPLKNLEEAAMGLGTYSERDRVYAQQQLLAFEYGMDRMTEQSWRFVSAVVNDRLQSFYDDGRLWAVGGKPSRQAQEQIDRGEAPAGDTWFMGPPGNRTAQEVFVSEFSAFQAPPWRPESASQWAAERGKYIVSHPSLVPGAARQMRIQFQDLPPYFWAAASEDWSVGVIKYTLPSMGLLAYAIGRTGVALNSAQFLDDPDVQEVISRLSQQSFETATQEAFSPDRMLLVSEYTRMAQGNSDPEVKLHPWLALQLQGMLPGSVLEQPGRTTTIGANQTDSKFYLKGPLAAAWIGVPGSNDVNQLLSYISAPEDWVRAHGEISTSPEDWAKWKAWAEENAALGIDAVPTYPVDLPPDALWYYRALLLLGRQPRALTPEREAYYEVPKVQTEKPGIDTKRPNPITR